MRVVIFEGNFQYDVVTDFGRSVGEVLQNIGYEVFYINLNEAINSDELRMIFSKRVDFVIGFNGLGYELTFNGESLYDAVDTIYVLWLVDHPIHLFKRVLAPIKRKVVVCIDESHVDYIEQHMDSSIVTTCIPHAAQFVQPVIEEKQYDVVFSGYIDETEQYNNDLNEIAKLLPTVRVDLETLLAQQGYVNLGDFINERYESVAGLKQFVDSQENLQSKILYLFDRYIRSKKRNDVIGELLKQHVKVNFFGIISNNHPFLQSPYFINHGSVNFNQLKQLLPKTKLFLNVMPNFPNGGHERIFTAMMHGTVAITDANQFTDQQMENVVSYNYTHLQQLPTTIQQLLHNENQLNNLQQRGYEEVVENHTWQQRVDVLLYVVDVANQHFAKQV